MFYNLKEDKMFYKSNNGKNVLKYFISFKSY